MRLKFSWPPDACSSSSLSADAGSSAVECREETQPSQSENDESPRDRSTALSTAADGSCDCHVKMNYECDGAGLLGTLEDSDNTVFESGVIDSETTFENKVIALIETWKACKILCDRLNGTHVFVHFAASDSTLLIMDPRWTSISKKIASDFIFVLHSISKVFQEINYECCKETMNRLNFLISIIEDPRSNTELSYLLGNSGSTSQDKVFDFCHMSGEHFVFADRFKLLSVENCETEADNKLMYLYHKKQDCEFIKDVYHGCLIQYFEMDELSNYLKEFISRNDSKNLIKVYASKIYFLSNLSKENRPRICDDVVVACKMIADILVAESLRNPDLYDEFSDLISIWIAIMSKLMDSNFNQNINISCLKDTISKFIECAESSRNLYLFYEILHEKFGSKLPLKLYLEMYVKALCNNINEKEFYRHLNDVESTMYSVTELIQGYLKLANILENVVSVSRECVLTAFSLRPSEDLMHQIQNLAIKSGKLCPEHLIDVCENSCKKSDSESFKDNNYNYSSYIKIRSDLNNLSDPLTPTMQDNLILVIQNPRYGPLNWDLKWSKMRLLCQDFLDCSDTMNRRHTLQQEDLKYIDIDIEKYNIQLETALKKSDCQEIVQSKQSLPKQKGRRRLLKAISIKKKKKAATKNTPKATLQNQQTFGSQKSFYVTNDLNVSIPGKEIENLKERLQKQRSCRKPSKAKSSKKKLKAAFQSSSRNILSKQCTIASQKNTDVTSDSSYPLKESQNKKIVLSSESLQKQRGPGKPLKVIGIPKKTNATSQNISKVTLQKQKTIGSQKNDEVTRNSSNSNAKKKFKVEEKLIKELPSNENVTLKCSLQIKRGRGRPPKAISSKKKWRADFQRTPKIILLKQETIGSQKNVDVSSDTSDSNAKKKFKVEEKVIKELPGNEIINLTDSLQIKRGRGRPPKAISSKKKWRADFQRTPKIILLKQETIGSQKNVEVSSDSSDSNAKKKLKVGEKVIKNLPSKKIVHSKESIRKHKGRGRPLKAISKAASHNKPKALPKQQTIGSLNSFEVTNDSNTENKCLIEEKGPKELLIQKSHIQEKFTKTKRLRKAIKVISIEKKSIAASQNTPIVTLTKQETIESQKSTVVTNNSNGDKKIEILKKF